MSVSNGKAENNRQKSSIGAGGLEMELMARALRLTEGKQVGNISSCR